MIEELPDYDELIENYKNLQNELERSRHDILHLKGKLVRQAAFIDATRQLMREHGLKLKRPAKVLPKHNWSAEVAEYDDE